MVKVVIIRISAADLRSEPISLNILLRAAFAVFGDNISVARRVNKIACSFAVHGYAVTVTVEKGADSVDFKLVNMIGKNDIAVTQDYGLAAMCLARGARPLNQNGLVYNDQNIDELLFSRYVSKKIRSSGGRLKGPSKRTAEQDKKFLEQLEKLIEYDIKDN